MFLLGMQLVRLRKYCHAFAGVATLLLCADIAHAGETVAYTYDVLGRLVGASHTGGPADGQAVGVDLDAAGNRTGYQLTGVAPAACTFRGNDKTGSDEFDIYPFVDRTNSCSQNVQISYSVEYVSGQGQYTVLYLYPGNTFYPSTQAISLKISPYAGSVPAGNPLKLRIKWKVLSGDGSISPGESNVTVYNADCYC